MEGRRLPFPPPPPTQPTTIPLCIEYKSATLALSWRFWRSVGAPTERLKMSKTGTKSRLLCMQSFVSWATMYSTYSICIIFYIYESLCLVPKCMLNQWIFATFWTFLRCITWPLLDWVVPTLVPIVVGGVLFLRGYFSHASASDGPNEGGRTQKKKERNMRRSPGRYYYYKRQKTFFLKSTTQWNFNVGQLGNGTVKTRFINRYVNVEFLI